MKRKSRKRRQFKWHVFICHVTEDKSSFVLPLTEELQKFHIRVWLDKFILRVGDSLRRKIDEGLSKSRYGIVVFSPSFFQKRWSQAELDGLFAREMEGRKVILPIRHQIPLSEILNKVPLLAGKYILDSGMGTAEVARNITEVVRPKALKLAQSFTDAERTNNRLMEQLGKNPTVAYRVTFGHGASPQNLDLESLDKLDVRDAIGSIFRPGMRVDLFPKDRNEYLTNPVKFKLTLQDAGYRKFKKAMETGRAQRLTTGEFSDFQTSLELFPSTAGTQSLLIKPSVGESTPVRVTFGSGSSTVVYDLMTYRTLRSGTLEFQSIVESDDAPFAIHVRIKRRPKLDLKIRITSKINGKSFRTLQKFVRVKRALWESGRIEIFALKSGQIVLNGKLAVSEPSGAELQFGRFVDDVAAIADFFGMNIIWPSGITKLDIELLTLLKWMIEKKSYGTGARITSVVTKTAANADLFKTLNDGSPMIVTREQPIVFLGTPIEGYRLVFSLENTRLDDFELTKDRFERAAVGEQIELRVVASGNVFVKLLDMKNNQIVEKL